MPNLDQNSTTKYYDIIYKDWIHKDLTLSELGLIRLLKPSPARVLDIGCGSGRHSVPLFNEGYEVVGVEPLESMIKLFRVKNKEVPIINAMFQEAEIDGKFDLITVFWNAFCEVAKTESEAKEVLGKAKQLLNPEGKIVFNISPSDDGFETLNFEETITDKYKTYELIWRVAEFDKQNWITKSIERIVVRDVADKVIDDVSAEIVQKWWREEEIRSIAQSVGLSVEVLRIEHSSDDYFILS